MLSRPEGLQGVAVFGGQFGGWQFQAGAERCCLKKRQVRVVALDDNIVSLDHEWPESCVSAELVLCIDLAAHARDAELVEHDADLADLDAVGVVECQTQIAECGFFR